MSRVWACMTKNTFDKGLSSSFDKRGLRILSKVMGRIVMTRRIFSQISQSMLPGQFIVDVASHPVASGRDYADGIATCTDQK